MSIELLELIVTLVTSFAASSGFWVWISRKNNEKDLKSKLLMGLAHDRIVSLGLAYIGRGWVSQDEYSDLWEYLYKPYSDMGGNGSAKRVMTEVEKLPIKQISRLTTQELKNDFQQRV